MPGKREGGPPRGLRRDLSEALAALAAVDPEEPVGEGGRSRCHHCLSVEPRAHDEGCPWVEARVVLGDEAARSRRVGEDEEDLAERLEEGEPDPVDGRGLLLTLAAEARAEVAALGDEPVDDLPPAEPFPLALPRPLR